jgi:hypothetical protein
MLDLGVVDRGFYLRCLCGALVYMLDLGVVDRGFYLRCLCGALVYMLDLGVVDRDTTYDLPHPSQACKPVHHKGTVDKTHDLPHPRFTCLTWVW